MVAMTPRIHHTIDVARGPLRHLRTHGAALTAVSHHAVPGMPRLDKQFVCHWPSNYFGVPGKASGVLLLTPVH